MPEPTGFKGLLEKGMPVREAQAANLASVERWTQFREQFAALKPGTSEAFNTATREGQTAFNDAYKANVIDFTNNFDMDRLAEMNTQELMTVYTKFRDLSAFDEMIRLYESATDNAFRHAPVVREFLAVSHNKTGNPTEAMKVAEALALDGHGNGEVYGAIGKGYQLQKQAANALASALENGEAAEIDKAKNAYSKAFNISDDTNVPDNIDMIKLYAREMGDASRKAYHRGFMDTLDYYPGINAAYCDLADGDFDSAVRTAELARLAAQRDGDC